MLGHCLRCEFELTVPEPGDVTCPRCHGTVSVELGNGYADPGNAPNVYGVTAPDSEGGVLGFVVVLLLLLAGVAASTTLTAWLTVADLAVVASVVLWFRHLVRRGFFATSQPVTSSKGHQWVVGILATVVAIGSAVAVVMTWRIPLAQGARPYQDPFHGWAWGIFALAVSACAAQIARMLLPRALSARRPSSRV